MRICAILIDEPNGLTLYRRVGMEPSTLSDLGSILRSAPQETLQEASAPAPYGSFEDRLWGLVKRTVEAGWGPVDPGTEHFDRASIDAIATKVWPAFQELLNPPFAGGLEEGGRAAAAHTEAVRLLSLWATTSGLPECETIRAVTRAFLAGELATRSEIDRASKAFASSGAGDRPTPLASTIQTSFALAEEGERRQDAAPGKGGQS